MILMTALALALLQQPTTVPPTADVPGATTPQTPDNKPWPPPGVFYPGNGVIAPVVLTNPKPRYTP